MTKKEILSKIFGILEIEKPDMSEFDNRLKYQKIIYLLQASGISLGYGFNWYIKGPYSSPLAHDLFEIDDSIYKSSQNIVFNNHESVCPEIIKFKEKLGINKENVNYLEVLASLHYINKATFSGNGNFDDLKSRLLILKPILIQVGNINELIEEAYDSLSYFS